MRLWHIDLIPKLPHQQLLGQWREIHAIIGTINKHGKVNHSTINYVNDYKYPYIPLVAYAMVVADEMKRRGYKPNIGKFINKIPQVATLQILPGMELSLKYENKGAPIYLEHNDEYMQKCLENLRGKGVEI